MAHEPSFSEAWLHQLAPDYDDADPWSAHFVLGRQLRPFSLWHGFLLAEIDSPVLTGGDVGAADLLHAIGICRCRYLEFCGVPRLSLGTLWRLAGGGAARAGKAFREYLADFRTAPDYGVVPPKGGWSGEKRGQPPEVLKMVLDVVEVGRCGLREAWEMPEGAARWLHAMALRKSGVDLDFMTPEERQRQADLKRDDPALYEQLRAAAEEFDNGGWRLPPEEIS